MAIRGAADEGEAGGTSGREGRRWEGGNGEALRLSIGEDVVVLRLDEEENKRPKSVLC